MTDSLDFALEKESLNMTIRLYVFYTMVFMTHTSYITFLGIDAKQGLNDRRKSSQTGILTRNVAGLCFLFFDWLTQRR